MSFRGLFHSSGASAPVTDQSAIQAASERRAALQRSGGDQFAELAPDISGHGDRDRDGEDAAEAPSNRSAQDVLNELDERYLQEEFDPVREMFNNLPPDADQSLPVRARELELVAATIDKKLSTQVAKNYPHFVSGMDLISGISRDLAATRTLCAEGRGSLASVEGELSGAILRTLQKQRKMTRCRVVILQLMEVYSLLKQESEINALLARGEFTRAVSTYKQCLLQLAQSGLHKFTCLDDLRTKRFMRTAEVIASRVKERLLSLCKRFDGGAFRNLIEAMISLGDVSMLESHVRRMLPLAVEESAAEAITPFLQREYMQSLISMHAAQGAAQAIVASSEAPRPGDDQGQVAAPFPSPSPSPSPLPDLMSPSSLSREHLAALPRRPFGDLCAHVDSSQFALAFLTLLSTLADNLYAAQQMVATLFEMSQEEESRRAHAQRKGGEHSSAESSSNPISAALDSALTYLQSHRRDLWTRVAKAVSALLRSAVLTNLTISVDDLMRVLKAGQQVVDIGEAFANEGRDDEKADGASSSSSSSVVALTSPASSSGGGSEAAASGAGTIGASDPTGLVSLLAQKSREYVRNFLQESLELVGRNIESENWRPLAVELDFAPGTHLKEFKMLAREVARRSAAEAATAGRERGEEGKENGQQQQHDLAPSLLAGGARFTLAPANGAVSSRSASRRSSLELPAAAAAAAGGASHARAGSGVSGQAASAAAAAAAAQALYESFLGGTNPFQRCVMDQRSEDEARRHEARLEAERKAAAEALRREQTTRPALRAPGSGPVRAGALNLSVGRPNFAMPTTGGMTGGVPTVVPRAQAQANAAAAAAAAEKAANGTLSPPPASLSASPSLSPSPSPSGCVPSSTSSIDASASAPRPFVLHTTLSLSKCVGKYLSLMHSLPRTTMALDALHGVQEVFDLYAYTLFCWFGTNQSAFFLGQPAVTPNFNGELAPAPSAPNYLPDTYPALRALVTSVKTRVELAQFGGGYFARDHKREDVIAANHALQQAQQQLAEAQAQATAAGTATGGGPHGAAATGANGPLHHSASTPAIHVAPASAASSQAPQTISQAAAAQQAAAAAMTASAVAATPDGKKKDGDGFFSKLKEKMSSNKEAELKREAERAAATAAAAASASAAAAAAALPASASSSALSLLAHATSSWTLASHAHPHPVLVQLAPQVQLDLESGATLHGLAHRAHGAESLQLVVRLLEEHIEFMRRQLPSTAAAALRLDSFHKYLLSSSRDLRAYLYECCAPLLLPRETFLSKLNHCRWDIKDLQTKYNQYVDTIINTVRVHEMSLQSSGGVSPFALRQVWLEVVRQLSHQLVESYSRAKKCTTEGRGLMTLDLSALRQGLEKLSRIKPLPHWEHVLGFVNAFYLQEAELTAWAAAHPLYTAAQVQSVAECGCGAAKGKKERLALVATVTQAHAEAVAAARTRSAQQEKQIATAAPSTVESGSSHAGSRSRAGSRAASRPLTPSAAHDAEVNLKQQQQPQHSKDTTSSAPPAATTAAASAPSQHHDAHSHADADADADLP